MKYDGKTLLSILCCLLAVYGVIILVRKVLNRKEKNTKSTWSYYVEPYRYAAQKCECKSRFGVKYGCKKCYCGIKVNDIKNKYNETMKSTLVTCPNYIQDCKDYYSSRGLSFPQSVEKGCLTQNMREAIL